MSSNSSITDTADLDVGGNSVFQPRNSNREEKIIFRITVQFLKIISIFIKDPLKSYSGADICRKAKLKSGTVYPMLIKLEIGGWLSSELEKIDPRKEGRPKRRLYRITYKGSVEGRKILDEHFPSISFSLPLIGTN